MKLNTTMKTQTPKVTLTIASLSTQPSEERRYFVMDLTPLTPEGLGRAMALFDEWFPADATSLEEPPSQEASLPDSGWVPDHLSDPAGNRYRFLTHGEIIKLGDQAFSGAPQIVMTGNPKDSGNGTKTDYEKCMFGDAVWNAWFNAGRTYAGTQYNAGCGIMRRLQKDATL